MTPDNHAFFLDLTAKIVAGEQAGGRTSVPAEDRIPAIYAALAACGQEPASEAPAELKPAVPVKKSITPDAIISLEDGSKHTLLKPHLTKLGMTPDQYRAKWGLPDNYPMAAPNYAKRRSALAVKIGLGRK